MDGIRQYIFTVLAAAIITSLFVCLAGKQQATAGLVKLIGAVFISINVMSPFISLQLQDVSDYMQSLKLDANDIIAEAKSEVIDQTVSVITEKTQTYIKDKAAAYGASITATVGISDPDLLVPDTITIEGAVSPYIKQILQEVITNDLGIGEDKQTWQ